LDLIRGSTTSTDSKFCPVCGETFGPEEEQCPTDGARLLLAAEEASLLGETLDGRYEIRDVLGEGGMGIVYLAHQPTMDRDVAVKVLHPYYSKDKEALQRFLREARAASKLRHPNTIRVFDFGQTSDGLLYMVLEILRGRALADIIDNDGAIHYSDAIDIAVQVCDALSEAHEQGIVHRDLKPDNIHIEQAHGRPNHVKLLDFGIARMESDVRATQTGAIVGTPTYMSPEQATGAAPVDGRADIYALGCIIYEMITGTVAFQGATPLEVLVKHLNEPPPPIPADIQAEVPDALLELIDRTMAKRPEDRYESCELLRDALLQAEQAPLQAAPQAIVTPGGSSTATFGTGSAVERPNTRPGRAVARLSDVGLAPAEAPQGGFGQPPNARQPTPDRSGTTADLFPMGVGDAQPAPAQPQAAPPQYYSQGAPRPTGSHRIPRPTGAQPLAGTSSQRNSTPVAPNPVAAPTRRSRTTSTRLRPANIPMQRAGNGHRYELLMSSSDRGVLHCQDTEPPKTGARFELIGNDVVLRNVQLTVEVVSTENTAGMPWVNVRWVQFAASGPRQMRAAFQKLMDEAIHIPADYDHLTDDLWLAYDPQTGLFSAIPAPIRDTRRRRQSSKRMRAVKQPRRILEITSKKGRKN